ncbi:MAG: PH domain-containing protein [Bryobacteraceae bacterium]|nr:PH domain-containing protein [Bryobacteraceae bacterium]
MAEAITGNILRWLRVPPQPSPPEGSPESIRVFRAGRNYYRYRLLVWAVSQLGLAAALLVGLLFSAAILRKLPAWVAALWASLEVLAILSFAAGLLFTYLVQRLNYELRWYIVTDRSLRIRSGIWSVEEITMTFANIQDLRVTAGPVQGWLGIADLQVRSAGGGGKNEMGVDPHAAYFHGVENAESIRDLIIERLRRYRDAGLGDPDSRERPTPESSPEAAAARVLSEVRALRQVLAGRP